MRILKFFKLNDLVSRVEDRIRARSSAVRAVRLNALGGKGEGDRALADEASLARAINRIKARNSFDMDNI